MSDRSAQPLGPFFDLLPRERGEHGYALLAYGGVRFATHRRGASTRVELRGRPGTLLEAAGWTRHPWLPRPEGARDADA